MTKLTILGISAAAMAVTLGSLATGAPQQAVAGAIEGFNMKQMMQQRIQRVAEELELTDEQRTEIREVLKDNKDTLRFFMKKVMEERRALRDVVMATPLDESAIRKQTEAASTAQADMAVAVGKVVAKLQPVLTEEQRTKLDELRQQRQARVNEWMSGPGLLE